MNFAINNLLRLDLIEFVEIKVINENEKKDIVSEFNTDESHEYHAEAFRIYLDFLLDAYSGSSNLSQITLIQKKIYPTYLGKIFMEHVLGEFYYDDEDD